MSHLFLLNFWILSLFFENGSQAQYVNSGCLKCISGIDLSPANKNLFKIHFIPCINMFNTLKTKEDLQQEFYLKIFLFLSYVVI